MLLGREAAPAFAQDGPVQAKVAGFVPHLVMLAPPDVDLAGKRSQVELALGSWGLGLSNCDYLRKLDAELDAEIEDRYPTWRDDVNLATNKKILSAQCLPPEGSTSFYIAKVTLDVEPDFGDQKRATVQLLPVGEDALQRQSFQGGYAHRPFVEAETWTTMLDRALSRALGQFNEPPSMYLEGKAKTRVGKPVGFDGSRSWDPDGDPFEIQWKASVPACVGEDRLGGRKVLPRFGTGCPSGTQATSHTVPMTASESRRQRELLPAVIGEYTLTATALSGGEQVGEPVERKLKVRPRHNHSFGTLISAQPVPAGLLADDEGARSTAMTRLFYRYRMGASRFGNGVAEGFVGLNVGNYAYDPFATSVLLNGLFGGVEGMTRLTGARGRVGLELASTFHIGSAATWRGGVNDAAAIAFVETRYAAFVSLADAYGVSTDRSCVGICLSASLGGSINTHYIADTGRFHMTVTPVFGLGYNP